MLTFRLVSPQMFARPPVEPTMPPGLVELMEGLTRDVLKNNPSDLYEFCTAHMQKLLAIRDGRAPKVPLTLEQKIKIAQEKVRRKAEERRHAYDEAMKLHSENTTVAVAIQDTGATASAESVPSNENALIIEQSHTDPTENIAKSLIPVHHDLIPEREVEIFHESNDSKDAQVSVEVLKETDDEIKTKDVETNNVEAMPVTDREVVEPTAEIIEIQPDMHSLKDKLNDMATTGVDEKGSLVHIRKPRSIDEEETKTQNKVPSFDEYIESGSLPTKDDIENGASLESKFNVNMADKKDKNGDSLAVRKHEDTTAENIKDTEASSEENASSDANSEESLVNNSARKTNSEEIVHGDNIETEPVVGKNGIAEKQFFLDDTSKDNVPFTNEKDLSKKAEENLNTATDLIIANRQEGDTTGNIQYKSDKTDHTNQNEEEEPEIFAESQEIDITSIVREVSGQKADVQDNSQYCANTDETLIIPEVTAENLPSVKFDGKHTGIVTIKNESEVGKEIVIYEEINFGNILDTVEQKNEDEVELEAIHEDPGLASEDAKDDGQGEAIDSVAESKDVIDAKDIRDININSNESITSKGNTEIVNKDAESILNTNVSEDFNAIELPTHGCKQSEYAANDDIPEPVSKNRLDATDTKLKVENESLNVIVNEAEAVTIEEISQEPKLEINKNPETEVEVTGSEKVSKALGLNDNQDAILEPICEKKTAYTLSVPNNVQSEGLFPNTSSNVASISMANVAIVDLQKHNVDHNGVVEINQILEPSNEFQNIIQSKDQAEILGANEAGEPQTIDLQFAEKPNYTNESLIETSHDLQGKRSAEPVLDKGESVEIGNELYADEKVAKPVSSDIGKSEVSPECAREEAAEKAESPQEVANDGTMDLETAAVTIQKHFRTFLFKRLNFEDGMNGNPNSTDEDAEIEREPIELYPGTSSVNKERRNLGLSRMESVLQTVNEEKSLSLSTDDSSTVSSAATVIQAQVRGFLTRKRLSYNKIASISFVDGRSSSDDQQKDKKTVLNIHIVPEGEQFLSRDESLLESIDLSLDGSPPSSTKLHPLGYDKSEPRKQLKREDAIQSFSPPTSNSGKLSEDVDSTKDILNESAELEGPKKTDENTPDQPAQDPVPKKGDETISDPAHDDIGSCDTTPTRSTTVETVIELHKDIKNTDHTLDANDGEINREDTEIISSDESDVVTPLDDKSSTDSDSTSKLIHSGEFHDIVLPSPTLISRNDTTVVREFKNVLGFFLLWK